VDSSFAPSWRPPRDHDRVVRLLPLRLRGERSCWGRLFFPTSNAFASTLLALTTYAVGFAAQPLGALLFGHLGDAHRAQGHADRDAPVDGPGDHPDRGGAHLRAGRRAGGIILACCGWCRASASAASGAARCCSRWSGATGAAAACSGAGPSSACPPASPGVRLDAALHRLAGPGRGLAVPVPAQRRADRRRDVRRIGVRETPVFTRLAEERRIEQSPVLDAVTRQWREIALCALPASASRRLLRIHRVRAHVRDRHAEAAPGRRGGLRDDRAAVSVLAVLGWGYLSTSSGAGGWSSSARSSCCSGRTRTSCCSTRARPARAGRHRGVAAHPRHPERPAGRAAGRELLRPLALQRRLARLPPDDACWWTVRHR